MYVVDEGCRPREARRWHLCRASPLGGLSDVSRYYLCRAVHNPGSARNVLSLSLAASDLACGCAQGFGMIDDVALAGSKVALTILGWAPRLWDFPHVSNHHEFRVTPPVVV